MQGKEHWLSKFPLPSYVVPGAKIRLFINEGNHHNGVLHVRAIVDKHYVVFKRWWSGKQRWSYTIEDSMWWATWHAQGWLTTIELPSDKKRRRWTPQEEDYLVAEVNRQSSIASIAEVLDRTPGAIRERILILRYDGRLPYRRGAALQAAEMAPLPLGDLP